VSFKGKKSLNPKLLLSGISAIFTAIFRHQILALSCCWNKSLDKRVRDSL